MPPRRYNTRFSERTLTPCPVDTQQEPTSQEPISQEPTNQEPTSCLRMTLCLFRIMFYVGVPVIAFGWLKNIVVELQSTVTSLNKELEELKSDMQVLKVNTVELFHQVSATIEKLKEIETSLQQMKIESLRNNTEEHKFHCRFHFF